MPNQRNSARRRARRRRQRHTERHSSGSLGKLLIMLAIVAAIVLGVAIFFRVNVVDVQGNVIYSAEQVKQASGVEAGDNLLMVNRSAVSGSIQARMPYVQDVSVGLILPDTVVVQVKESDVVALVQSDTGADWYINTNGRVLGSALEGFRGQVITMEGFTIVAPKTGSAAVPTEGQEENLAAALEVIRGMEGTGLIQQITALDAERAYDLMLHIDNRLEILLGGTDQLDYKLQYLQEVLNTLEDYQAGIIDLTFDVKQVARFIPRVEEETEEIEETSDSDEETSE